MESPIAVAAKIIERLGFNLSRNEFRKRQPIKYAKAHNADIQPIIAEPASNFVFTKNIRVKFIKPIPKFAKKAAR